MTYLSFDRLNEAECTSQSEIILLDYAVTCREKQVLQELYFGLTNKQIAKKLHISAHTVRHHLSHIFEKMNISNRNQAVAKAISNGLVDIHSSSPPG